MSNSKRCTATTKDGRRCLLLAKMGSDYCGLHKKLDDLWEVRDEFEEWFRNLERICKVKAPWIFLCLCSVIDYLSKLANGKDCKSAGYKQFIEDYFPAGYKNFKYKNGEDDLPKQMYHVLRCGIVHSFSLIPDPVARKASIGGRNRSIVLDHAETARKAGYSHLDRYPGKSSNLDAAYFVAEVFLKDVEKVAYEMLQKAKTDKDLKNNILTWFRKYPPITGGF